MVDVDRFATFEDIDKYYNIRSLYEAGTNRKDIAPEKKKRLNKLVNEFVSENYIFDKKSQENNMKNKLKYKITESSSPSSQNSSHIYREFSQYCLAQKWSYSYKLLREGEGSTWGERAIVKNLTLENENLKAEVKKLKGELSFKDNSLEITPIENEISKTINTTVEEMSLKDNSLETIVVENENPSLLESIDEEMSLKDKPIEKVIDEIVEEELEPFTYQNLSPIIDWNITGDDTEKILRSACNDYASQLSQNYQIDFRHNKDNATPEFEIVMEFEAWFHKQQASIHNSTIDFKQIEDKLIVDIETNLEFISC